MRVERGRGRWALHERVWGRARWSGPLGVGFGWAGMTGLLVRKREMLAGPAWGENGLPDLGWEEGKWPAGWAAHGVWAGFLFWFFFLFLLF